MRLTLDPFRTSLLAALGLISCGPIDKTTGDDGGGTGATSTSGGSDTTASTGATDPTTGATDPTTQGSATGQTGGQTDTGQTDTGQTDTGQTTGGSTSSATGDTSSGGDTGAVSCPSEPVPAIQGFTEPPVPSGFERCEQGILHRAEKLDCEVPQTPSTCLDNMLGGCKTDADCVEQPFGSCQQDVVFGGFAEGSCSCVYGCQTDDDCDAGQICRCAGSGLGRFTECISAGCTADSDCPEGELCGLSADICSGDGILTACTTPDDTCESSATCGGSECTFEQGKWDCSNVACGRPFVVETQAVIAPLHARDDWRALLAAPGVEAAVAPRLAAYWANIGQLEHASVAAFAHFVLQLLAVGAPPALVLAAQRALADEVEHARLCFGLASLYGGAGVGPGPLAISGAVAPADLASLVDAVIREACIGETLAAFEAREAAAQAEDPAVRTVLSKIAEDEARHAELGWQFVQWALVDDDAVLRAQATFAEAVAEARRGVARDALAVGAPELRAHGVIDAPLRAEVWAAGLRAVVEPCAAALLSGRRAA